MPCSAGSRSAKLADIVEWLGLPFRITVDDPRADDVRVLLATHLAFSHSVTPTEFSFALSAEKLADPVVTLFSARDSGRLVGVAALKHLDETCAELKSMHTNADDRGRGVGRALVQHILAYATDRGYRRVVLETGTSDHYLAARSLYEGAGFSPCEAFGDYQPSPHNTFMAIDLRPETRTMSA